MTSCSAEKESIPLRKNLLPIGADTILKHKFIDRYKADTILPQKLLLTNFKGQ